MGGSFQFSVFSEESVFGAVEVVGLGAGVVLLEAVLSRVASLYCGDTLLRRHELAARIWTSCVGFLGPLALGLWVNWGNRAHFGWINAAGQAVREENKRWTGESCQKLLILLERFFPLDTVAGNPLR